MKLARFENENGEGVRIVAETDLADLTDSGLPTDTVDLIATLDGEAVESSVATAPRIPSIR